MPSSIKPQGSTDFLKRRRLGCCRVFLVESFVSFRERLPFVHVPSASGAETIKHSDFATERGLVVCRSNRRR